jgi:hypothetical protein
MIYNLNNFLYKFSISLSILTILIQVSLCALEEPTHDLIPWSKSQFIFFYLLATMVNINVECALVLKIIVGSSFHKK